MAAAVSGFLGFAISKVVDQFWTAAPEPEALEPIAVDNDHNSSDSVEPAVEPVTPTKPTQRKTTTTTNARRAPRRKMQTPAKPLAIELPLDVKARSYSDPAELASNASTCGSSDDEDEPEVEDIGAKEMRLMLERAQQIKRLTKQSRQQQRPKKVQPAKPKEEAATKAVEAAVPTPTRIQNTTTGLWKWSVYSGFAVDTRIANRGPRNMRHLYCTLGEAETLESEELLLALAAQVLADN